MKLHILGSSSSGNGYIMQSASGAALIIECGVPLQSVKRALAWRLSGVAGAIVSHHHGDHAKFVCDYSRAGIRIIAPGEVIDRHAPMFSHRAAANKKYRIGEFVVRTLPMQHANNDGTPCECFGYIITHPECGNVLFATDTIALPCAVNGLHQIMIEANYDDAILERNIAAGDVDASERDRLRLSHMEIGTTERMMRMLDTKSVVNVILLHLSARNAAGDTFARRIAAAVGKPCQIARPGMIIDFNKQPY
ncbi:MAG: MBL fold metallo-hydrolase [Ruminococcus sp.]|nr:MBL fold metallo-hydrolase [Ruminococcus sp.]MCM1438982.1 MBL fold metallo-hydrolase [Roseburia sp.]